MKVSESTGVRRPENAAPAGGPSKTRKEQFAAMLDRKKCGEAPPENETLTPLDAGLFGQPLGDQAKPLHGPLQKPAGPERFHAAVPQKGPGPRQKIGDRQFDRQQSTDRERTRASRTVMSDLGAGALVSQQPLPGPQSTAAPVGNAQKTAGPRQIDDLVQEISVAVRDDRTTQVDIQLNSQTFNGLRIQITGGQTGPVGIQFITASPQVSEFLAGNLDRLTDGLAQRGVSVSEIRIGKRDGLARNGDTPQKGGGAGARQGRK